MKHLFPICSSFFEIMYGMKIVGVCIVIIWCLNFQNLDAIVNKLNLNRYCHLSVKHLEKIFLSPKLLIHKIFEPLISIDKNCTPKVECCKKWNNRTWRAKINFQWPTIFHVFGDGVTEEEALNNAYLSACRTFLYTGLVTPNGDLVDLKKKLQLFEHNWRVQYGNLSDGLKTVVETLSVDPPQWKATISLPGHYGFHMSGCGASRKLALRHAYMNAIVKITMSHKMKPRTIVLPNKCSGCSPHYEFFVDASQQGFGAYLIDHTSEGNGLVRWLQEKWPAEILTEHVLRAPRPSFLEFYALVSAVFTWKKRFQGRHVVAWSDSASCVELITYGLRIEKTTYLKLYQLLNYTCTNYNISLSARHVFRTSNVAADLLAHLEIDRFREMVSNTCDRSKKTKKLQFCFPLIPYNSNCRSPKLKSILHDKHQHAIL